MFVLQLFVKYHSLLAQADRQTEQEIAHLSRIAERNRGPEGEAAELELELLEDADMQYVKVAVCVCVCVCIGLSRQAI